MPNVAATSLSFSESFEVVTPMPLIFSSSLAAIALAFSYSEDALPRDLASSGIFFAPKIIIATIAIMNIHSVPLTMPHQNIGKYERSHTPDTQIVLYDLSIFHFHHPHLID